MLAIACFPQPLDLLVENVSGEMTRNLRRMQVAPKGVSGLDQ